MMAQNERVCVCVCGADTAVGWTVFAASDRRKSTRHRPIHVSCPQRLWSTELHATARRHRSVATRSLRALIDRHLLFEKPYYALIQQSKLHKIICKPERRPEKQTGHITRVLSLYIIIRSLSPYSLSLIHI